MTKTAAVHTVTLSTPVGTTTGNETTTTWTVNNGTTEIGAVTTSTETGTYTAAVNGFAIEDIYISRREATTAVQVAYFRSVAL